MKKGMMIQLPNDDSIYEIVAVKGASLELRRAGGRELFWVIEDDLP